VAVLLGGTQAFFGPVLGAVVFKALGTFVGIRWLTTWPLVLGLVVALVLLGLPRGVISLFEPGPWRFRRRTPA